MRLRLQLDRQPGAGVLWSGVTCKVCVCVYMCVSVYVHACTRAWFCVHAFVCVFFWALHSMQHKLCVHCTPSCV